MHHSYRCHLSPDVLLASNPAAERAPDETRRLDPSETLGEARCPCCRTPLVARMGRRAVLSLPLFRVPEPPAWRAKRHERNTRHRAVRFRSPRRRRSVLGAMTAFRADEPIAPGPPSLRASSGAASAPCASVSSTRRASGVAMDSSTRMARRCRRSFAVGSRRGSANKPSMRRRTSSDGLPCNASRKAESANSPNSLKR